MRISLIILALGILVASAQAVPTPTPTYSAGISDTCAAPRALSCGDTVYASISSATADDPDSVNDGIRDQWYVLTGPARRASVSTCNGFTNFNTFLEIFTGACSSLSRRAYNDNDAGCSLGGGASNVSWDAFFGVQYRIRVRPKYNTTTTGNYGLTLSCGATLPTPTPTPTPTPAYSAGISDTCAAPRALNCGNTVYASISSATAVDPDSVNDGIRDQWYILTGPGQRLTATTCNGFTDLNTFLEIYVGACSGLGRLAYNDNDVTCNVPVGASTVSWDGMTGTQYRIRVRPKFNTTTTGNYALTLSCGALL